MAGGEAWLIFNAWRYGGEDPWRLYNRLDPNYRPLHDPALPLVRPQHPGRVRAFMYACGKAAAIIEGRMEDTRPQVSQQKPRDPRRRRVVLPPGVRA